MSKTLLGFLFWILKKESTIVLKRFKPQIIAVTGSVAKTSTKEAIFAVLATKFKDRLSKSYGNLNNEIGIPLSILGFKFTPTKWQWTAVIFSGFFRALFIRKFPDILVLEMAADKPGDIDYFNSFIKPNISLVTTVGPAHLATFKTIDGVFREKRKLVENLPSNGIAVLNKLDPQVVKMKDYTKAKIVWYNGTGWDIAQKAAMAVADIFKIKKTIAEKAIKSAKDIKGRMNLLAGYRKSKIIDDTYNSNPLSCSAALDFLSWFKNRRKIAILGDMLELGSYSEKAHSQIAQKARKIADLLILVGENFKIFPKSDYWYPDCNLAAANIKKIIVENDVILVKGSQGIRMEKIVEKIMANPERAKNLLVRQSKEWKSRK